jgi:hypothetical protein
MASTPVLIDWSRFANIKRKHPFTIEKPEIDARRLKLIKNAIRRRKKREAILEKEFEEMKQKLAFDPHIENRESCQKTKEEVEDPVNRNLGEKEQLQNSDKGQQFTELKEIDEKMAALELKIQTLNNEKHNLVSTLKNMLLEEKKKEEEERIFQEQRLAEQHAYFEQMVGAPSNGSYMRHAQSEMSPQGPSRLPRLPFVNKTYSYSPSPSLPPPHMHYSASSMVNTNQNSQSPKLHISIQNNDNHRPPIYQQSLTSRNALTQTASPLPPHHHSSSSPAPFSSSHPHSPPPYIPRHRTYEHTYNEYDSSSTPLFTRSLPGKYPYPSYSSRPPIYIPNYPSNSPLPEHVKGYSMPPLPGRGFRHPHSRHHHHHQNYHPYPSHHNPYRYYRN